MIKKTFLSFALLFSLIGCSRLDLAVNLANSYLTNKADNYFDLTGDQKKWLKTALDKNIAIIKKTILPQLAAELIKTADVINGQRIFDTSMVLSSYERLENLMYEALRVASSDAVTFASKLAPGQINVFQKEFDAKVAELKEKPEKKSYEKIKKQFDSWMGGLSSSQKKELKQFIEKNPPLVAETIYSRQLLVHGFVRAYPDSVARKKYVEKLFTQYDSMREPSYRKLVIEKNKKVAGFVSYVLNGMSDDQRQTLVDTLRDRANQLIKISKG